MVEKRQQGIITFVFFNLVKQLLNNTLLMLRFNRNRNGGTLNRATHFFNLVRVGR